MALGASAPLDLSRQANGDVLLVATVRFDIPPAADAALIARCGRGCDRAVGLASAAAVTGRFVTMGVPLKCFGSDLSAVEMLFAVRSTGAMRFMVPRVALGTAADHTLPCG